MKSPPAPDTALHAPHQLQDPGGVEEVCFPSEDTLIPQGLWAISRASVVLAEVPCPVMASGWGLGGSLFSVQPSLNLLAAVSLPNTLFKTNPTL